MHYRKLPVALTVCATVVITLFLSSARVSADDSNDNPHPVTPTPYNPYPPGILPADLNSELDRVYREINGIEQEAIAQWKALGPVTYTGNPPIIQGNGYDAVRILGKLMNFDTNISPFKNVACASCHMPYTAFSGPIPSVNLTMIAYPGSFHYRAGKRTAQRYSYSVDFPVLEYNTTQGAFFGGNFWDSRATGYELQSPDAHQAQGPPVDALEHMFPDTACIVYRLSQAVYRPLFELIWGADSFDIKWPHDVESICDTPGGAALLSAASPAGEVIPPPAKRSARVQITEAPSVESFGYNSQAIIRWTSNNPGGTDEHWGVVYYGTDPDHLAQMAKGHIRLNRGHSYTVFRVRLINLKPATTYYYKVDSMEADGTRDRTKSAVYRLVTPRNLGQLTHNQ